MKRKIYVFGMILSIIIITVFANFLYNNIGLGIVEESSDSINKKVKEWKKPSIEYLEYYGLDDFDTNLPVLYIDTKDQRITKENKIWGTLAVINKNLDKAKRNIYDRPDHQIPITINLRGASSYSGFDKEQYRIKFYKREGEKGAKNYQFLGMGANSEWVLNGPFLDKTLLRNKVIYQVSREIFQWAPDTRFCEVFVDGEYRGVYLAVEPVTNGESRLRLSEFGLLSGKTAYIVKRDREGTEDNPLKNYGKIAGKTSNDLYISYPSQYKITKSQQKWIENDISNFEKVLYSKDFDDPIKGYSQYIDIDNFVDYVVLNESVMNNDAGNLSTYIYKELEGKLQITVWDFNNVYNNYQTFRQDYSKFFIQEMAWFSRLLEDRKFVDKVVKRYKYLRNGVLSTENLYNLIEEGRIELGDAIERNFAIWGYTFSEDMMISGGGADPNPSSYADAIDKLKSSIEERLVFLDNHITDLYKGCIN